MTSYACFSIVRFFILAFDDCRGLDFVFFNLEKNQIHGIEVVFLLILDVRKFTVKYMANFNNSFIHLFLQ